jgi:predicted ABC-type transport system involved in lysophospholipase L1 biosynthesis ATPase subunit
MTLLQPRGVHRVHGFGETAVHALRGIDLTVAPAELVAVMGSSGVRHGARWSPAAAHLAPSPTGR